MDEKSFKRRVWFCIAFVLAIIGFYFFRLIDWQIINADDYLERASMGRITTVRTEPIRGEILDVNGVNFTVNKTMYRIVLDRVLIDKDKEDEIIRDLISLMEYRNEEWINELPIKLDSSGNFVFEEDKEKEIEELKNKNNLNLNSYATAEECIKKLAKDLKCEDINLKENLKLLSVKYNMLKSGYFKANSVPYVFAKGISQELVNIIAEKYQDRPGVRIETFAEREISDPTLAPHILGTVGKMSQERYEKIKDQGYSIDDVIGQNGIESVMEEYLRGKSGEKRIEISYEGHLENTIKTKASEPGNTVYLTIDSRLQNVANKALEEQINFVKSNAGSAKGHDCKAGGVVAINVKDFSVLAAATFPTYDPVKYLSDKEYYKSIMDDKALPLYNRALLGSFAPGSVFKPVVAAGALQEGVLTDTEKITCNHVYYYPGTNFATKCLGNHGAISLNTAMEKSCNVYFMETGRRLGIENLNQYCKKFGLGVKTGVELPETAGVLAGPEHSKLIGSTWSKMLIVKASIGQSDNLFSPLQLATYAATIANGGKRYRTHFIRKVMDYKKENVIMENDPENPELVEECGVSAENMEKVRRSMKEVVNGGVSQMLKNLPVSSAAKTGTAQNSGSDHKNFICFAPYENPEIAVGVVIEHGYFPRTAASVAYAVLSEYFANKQ